MCTANSNMPNAAEIRFRNDTAYCSIQHQHNTYEEYNQAKHQNARGIAIATNCGMEMVTPWGTQINLFDPIEVIIPAGALGASTNRTARDPNAGPYFVLGRIISFQGANYAEKLLAYREGYME